MTDEREIRKQIAEDAQVDSATAASPAVRAFQFFLVPLLIVGVCVLFYAGVSLLMGSPRTAQDWLQDIRQGGLNTRPYATLQLAQTLRRQDPPDTSITPEVIKLFQTSRPEEQELRRYLAQCLGYLRDPRASEMLLEAVRKESDIEIRAACMDALGSIKDPGTLPDLVKLLDDSDGVVRKYAAFAVGAVAEKAGDRSVIEPLKRKLTDPKADVTWNAAFALAYFLGDGSGNDTLKKMLDRKYLTDVIGNDPNADILIARAMVSACNAAAKLNDKSFLPQLEKLSDDAHEHDSDVRHIAQKAVAVLRQ